jgi:hypothetical protein
MPRLVYNSWNASPSEDVDRVVKAMAHAENRSLSNMVLTLVIEALEYRRIKRDEISSNKLES